MIHEDQCITYDTEVARRSYRDKHFEEAGTVLFRLAFKHLGKIGTAMRQTPPSEPPVHGPDRFAGLDMES
jgi:hypothetical protein